MCKVLECSGDPVGRGWCSKHYKRWQVHGDSEKVVNNRIHGMTVKERILDTIVKDKETGCWNWAGSISRAGRGRLKVKRKVTIASRASYEAFIGDIPDGLFVCHKCDNPLCVNPSHLFVGSAKDNTMDAVSKGRHPKHERHNKAKLTMEKANHIRKREMSANDYADLYGVHWSTIYNVWSNKIWVNSNQRKGNV